MQPILVTGTDTGVGKTLVSAYLLKQLRAQGLDAGYWKPVETGVPENAPEDAATVLQIAGTDAPVVTTMTLPEPLAPNVAARRAGRPVDLALLDETQARLSKMYAPLLIEGAGGLLVQVTDEASFADLAERWHCRVMLVVGNKLGCLNHAMLTVRELERRGLELGGWILNHITPPESIAQQTNLEELTRLLGPPQADIPYNQAATTALL